jgi:hypothetical protein
MEYSFKGAQIRPRRFNRVVALHEPATAVNLAVGTLKIDCEKGLIAKIFRNAQEQMQNVLRRMTD